MLARNMVGDDWLFSNRVRRTWCQLQPFKQRYAIVFPAVGRKFKSLAMRVVVDSALPYYAHVWKAALAAAFVTAA